MLSRGIFYGKYKLVDMKKNTIKFIYLVISLAIIIWLFYREYKAQKDENLMFDKEYPKLLKRNYLGNNIVIDIFKFSAGSNRDYPYASSFCLADSSKYTVYSYKCINYTKTYINDIIERGVSLYKPKNSDTLKVTNNGVEYFFIIEETCR